MTNRFDQLKTYLRSQGWPWQSGKTIPHGEQIIVTAGNDRATVNFYPKRERLVVGGPNSALKTQLEAWISGESAEVPPVATNEPSGSGANRLDDLKAFIRAQGWNWGLGAAIPYGEQIVVSDAGVTALVNFWPKRGKMQVQGRDSALKARLETWVSATANEAESPDRITGPHLGLDESGKGDWFGPLVVAAVYVDQQAADLLQRRGVRDSKALSPTRLQVLAGEIERLVPASNRQITILDPADYNRRYEQYGNINRLLADLYAETAGPVWQSTHAESIVCDQFARRTDRLSRALAAHGLPEPHQAHRAESISIAVAAASILAGATFNSALAGLGAAAGLDGPLPKGSSDRPHLEAAARHIIQTQGAGALADFAKLNFKPVRRFLV